MKLTISKELEQRLSAISENPIVQAIISRDNLAEDCINYLSISDQNPAYISYLTKDRLDRFITEGERWDPKKRYHGKSGAVLEKLFPGEFNSKEKQDFTSLFKIEGCKECESEKVIFFKGNDIAHYYNKENYIGYSDGGEDRDDEEWQADEYAGTSLWESCMKYRDCRNFFGIYTENPDIVSLAVLFNNGEVAARCICWTPKEYNGKKFFDRIYSCNDYYWNMMFGCLIKDGWKNISSKNNMSEYITDNLQFKLDRWEFDYYPYVDTMRWLINGEVNNYSEGEAMECTDGSICGVDPICACCAEPYCEDDLRTINRGSYRHDMLCEDCRVYSEDYDEYIAEGNAVELYNGNWVLDRDTTKLWDGTYAWDMDSALLEDIDGNYFIAGDEAFEEIEGDWYKIGSESHKQIQEKLVEI